jgi:hypothetical protein
MMTAAGRAAAAPADTSDPLVLQAQLREASGRLASARQRKTGRVPAVIFNQARRAALHTRARRTDGGAALRALYVLVLTAGASRPPQFNEDKVLITLDGREVLRRVRARGAQPQRARALAALALQGFEPRPCVPHARRAARTRS